MPDLALDPYFTTVRLDNIFSQDQAQAGPFDILVDLIVDPEKFTEQFLYF